MNNKFELDVSLFDKAYSFAKYFNRYLLRSKLVKEEEGLLDKLRENGQVVLENFIPRELIASGQSKIDHHILKGDFSFPLLATKKIDSIRHKKLIDQKLLGTPNDYKKWGVAATKSDFVNIDQFIEEFGPSTLTIDSHCKDSFWFKDILLNETILRIVNEYMKLRPNLIESYIRRNYPAKHLSMNHFWHRDINHKYLLKVFFFFSDCEIYNGPHEYVEKSHKNFNLAGERYYSDEEVIKFSLDNNLKLVKSIVRAGTVIIEDTRGLHRAIVPKSGYRDVGYSVFVPHSPFSKAEPLFQVTRTVFNSLSRYQKSYLRKGNVTEQ